MTNDNKISKEGKELARKVDVIISKWDGKSLRHLSCLCDEIGLNEEGFSILVQIDSRYITYRDYYLCGKIERENGR